MKISQSVAGFMSPMICQNFYYPGREVMVLQQQGGEKAKKMGRPEVSPHPGGILGFYCRLIMPVCSTNQFLF